MRRSGNIAQKDMINRLFNRLRNEHGVISIEKTHLEQGELINLQSCNTQEKYMEL